MFWCERTVSSSCSSRPISHSLAVIAAWSPIARPVRGSALRGISGTSWPGRILASAFSRSCSVLALFSADQHAAQVVADGERGVGRGVDAAGDAGLDLPEGDLVGDQDRGLEAGAAGLLDVVGRRGRPTAWSRARSRGSG